MRAAKCLAAMYHYVRDRSRTRDSEIRGLDPEQFTAQLDLLCRHLEPIDWPTFRAWKAGRASVPEHCFLLTFDDALSDHAEVVAPMLEARGLRGVFFVSTSPLVDGRLCSAHETHVLLARLGPEKLHEEVTRWLAANSPRSYWDPDADAASAHSIYSYEPPPIAELKYLLMRVLPVDLRRDLLQELFQVHVGHSRDFVRRWYMALPQMEDLQASGHTLGGHGHLHEVYTAMTSDQKANDIRRTATFLREGLGDQERPFSYPFGNYDAEVIDLIRDAGFVQGFTTECDWIKRGTDEFHLGRCDANNVDAFIECEVSCT